jgi:signal transduction histidine kinase/DNA-binding response OmpR family regulator
MILIVDDKSENIFSLKSVLEANLFEVDTALSGEEALRKVLKNTYTLVILDVQMPGMDGFEVAEALTGLSRTKDIPIIFLSAVNTHKSFITKGFASGAIDYITKPVDPDILILKVRMFDRLYEQSRALNKAHNALKQEIEVRKEAEQALSDTVNELHSTLQSIPQIAFTARPDGTLEFVNQYWYRYSDSKKIFPVTHPDEKDLAQVWEQCLRAGREWETEVRIKEQISETYRYHLMRALPVTSDGQIVKWVGTFTDIHEQKLLSENLEQRVGERTRELEIINRELEASNHDLQQFASVASHDLQEPLRKIQLFSSLIQTRPDADPEMVNYLRKIRDSSARMRKLIEDLLSFARISQAATFEITSIATIVRDILVDLELLIQEKKATLDIGPLPVVEVVPGLIRQVFQNIISNALKFSKTDEPPLVTIRSEYVDEPSATAPSVEKGDYCRISIRDNGIGFDEQYVDKIFTLFQRLNDQEQYAGTGIGLAIAKKIVEKHNGMITVHSQPEEGSVFIVLLPVRQQM